MLIGERWLIGEILRRYTAFHRVDLRKNYVGQAHYKINFDSKGCALLGPPQCIPVCLPTRLPAMAIGFAVFAGYPRFHFYPGPLRQLMPVSPRNPTSLPDVKKVVILRILEVAYRFKTKARHRSPICHCHYPPPGRAACLPGAPIPGIQDAPASTAFSISSFTTEAGRCMTSYRPQSGL